VTLALWVVSIAVRVGIGVASRGATPLVCIGTVVALSPHVVAAAALWLGMPVGNFSLPFMFAVVVGAGTNYGLFLISRYREMLGRGLAPRAALEEALVQVGAAITSSAATVIAATAVMIFATFDLFWTLGPAIAISIAVMLLSGLTLLPALMSIFGRALLWPRKRVQGGPRQSIAAFGAASANSSPGSPSWPRPSPSCCSCRQPFSPRSPSSTPCPTPCRPPTATSCWPGISQGAWAA
jgi:uncharacterized membrane protein YdfJ with MMPL/SSD domain